MKVTRKIIHLITFFNPWAIRSTCHTTLQETPCLLVFGRGMMQKGFKANWNLIQRRKQNIIEASNKKERKTEFPMSTRLETKF
jgi:hypothetical protein